MSAPREWWARLRAFRRRHTVEAGLRDEIQFHLEQQVAQHLRAGMSPADARREAALTFGSASAVTAAAMDQVRPALFDDVVRDVRLGVRHIWRAPGFALASVLTMALGTGASTAMFAIVDAVLLRPLPLPEPDRLAMLQPSSGSRLSGAYLAEWRLQSRTIQDIAGWRDARAHLTGARTPREVLVDRATVNFFDVLGARPTLGRTFSNTGDLRRIEPEVVLSFGFWQQQYGSRPDVLGQALTLDGQVYAIVGVMPAGFTVRTTERAESRADVWTPLALNPPSRVGMGGVLNVVARLLPNVTFDQATHDLTGIASAIERQYPSYSRSWTIAATPLLDATVRDVRPTLLTVFAAVGLLLLIASTNVATLGLMRAASRTAEMAVRRSLGATTPRLVRQLIAESLVLTGVGSALGLGVAVLLTHAIVANVPAGLDVPRLRDVGLDGRVVLFAAVLAALSGGAIGIAPFIGEGRIGRKSLGDPSRTRLGGSLVVAEVAVATVLLVGAVTMTRSLTTLLRVDPGFIPAPVLTMRTSLSPARYASDQEVRRFGAALLDTLDGLPGVAAVGTVNYLPLSRFGVASQFRMLDRPDTQLDDRGSAVLNVVGGRYFDAMGIPLRRGRLPVPQDSERTGNVFVIDEQLARRYWPGRDPIGARLAWERGAGTPQPFVGEVIGIVGNVRWQSLAVESTGTAYWWFPQAPDRDIAIAIRSVGPVATPLAPALARIRALDADQPVADVRPLTNLVAEDVARPRFMTVLLLGFAAVALAMTAVGLYATVAFSVARRTAEIGVRVALGATYRNVMHLVLQRGTFLVGIGIGTGLLAAIGLNRWVAAMLYGVSASDPLTLAGVAVFLGAAAGVATWIPASRAARIDPTMALRAD